MNPLLFLTSSKLAIQQFKQALNNPEGAQRKVLRKIIIATKMTAIGKDYNLSWAMSRDEFRKQVPLTRYKDYLDYIQRIKKGEKNVLSRQKLLAMAITSGTTSEGKHIPIFSGRKKEYFRTAAIWYDQFLKYNKEFMKGKTIYLGAAKKEYEIEVGGRIIPCGSISGMNYSFLKTGPAFTRKRLILDERILNISDEKTRNIEMLKVSLAENISFIGASTATSIIKLQQTLEENTDILIHYFKRKGAKQVVQLLQEGKTKLSDFWKELAGIGNIIHDANKELFPHLYEAVGKKIRIYDGGVLASEEQLYTTIFDNGNSGCPLLNEVFYEFLPEGSEQTYLLHQLHKNKRYEVVITTKGGLLRYRMGDYIRVVGKTISGVPKIIFDGRDYLFEPGQAHIYQKAFIESVRAAAKRNKVQISRFLGYIEELGTKQTAASLIIETDKDKAIHNANKFIKEYDTHLVQTGLTYGETKTGMARNGAPSITQVKKGAIDELFASKAKGRNANQQKTLVFLNENNVIQKYKLPVIKKYTLSQKEQEEHQKRVEKIYFTRAKKQKNE